MRERTLNSKINDMRFNLNADSDKTKGALLADCIEKRLNESLTSYSHDVKLASYFLNNRPNKPRLLRSIIKELGNDK